MVAITTEMRVAFYMEVGAAYNGPANPIKHIQAAAPNFVIEEGN